MRFARTACRRLLRDERGAITVDWVLLTASVVIFGALAAGPVEQGVTTMMGSVVESLDRVPEVVRLPLPEE